MNWFQPDIANSRPDTRTLHSQHLMPLHKVLEPVEVHYFENVRLVYLDDRITYQVRLPSDAVLHYWDTRTGRPIQNGDPRYAGEPARHFPEDRVLHQ